MSRAPQLQVFLLAIAIGISTAASAQKPDYHLTEDPNHTVYKDSAFAHGHRHGYEEGFHAGDEDYHMRRPNYLLNKMPKAKGYVAGFGDKKYYMAGFDTGYRAGYADSFSGRGFRTWKYSMDPASAAKNGSVSTGKLDLDTGFSEGYHAGYVNSDNIADEPGVAESAAWRCQQGSHSPTFCQGYGAGYVLGRTDKTSVAVLQKAEPTSLAKNSGTH